MVWAALVIATALNAVFAGASLWRDQAATRDTHDARPTPTCNYHEHDGGRFEMVPMVVLLASPGNFEGCQVTVQGYLQFHHGTASLFLGESDARMQFLQNSIGLDGVDYEAPIDGPVTLHGTFYRAPKGLSQTGILRVVQGTLLGDSGAMPWPPGR